MNAVWRSRALAPLIWVLAGIQASALSLDDLVVWFGEGTNRAALVIHWRPPEVRNGSSVPAPFTQRSYAWGFRWNGLAQAEEMLNAVLAGDPRLFALVSRNTPVGKAFLGFGFDLNGNTLFGANSVTSSTIFSPEDFLSGLAIASYSAVDKVQSLDPGDLFWSGWNGPNWEVWREAGGTGGRTEAPDRGEAPYWTPGPGPSDIGTHGEWEHAPAGVTGVILADGSWIGLTVAAGGLDVLHPDDEGSVAWRLHKQAPAPPLAVPHPSSPFAARVVHTEGSFGPPPYNDPTAVLGAPTLGFHDPFGAESFRRATIIQAAYHQNSPDGTNLLLTLSAEESAPSRVLIELDRPAHDHPANPYGIDFLVFGNAFYPGADSFVSELTNLNDYRIVGGAFAEPLRVAVSPGYTGTQGEDPERWETWPWYSYESGPFADSDFPTQSYRWDREAAAWTKIPSDFTRPVHPEFRIPEGADQETVWSAADVLEFSDGSGGGAGFDLRESGFSEIRYVRVEAAFPEHFGGEVDAVAVVRPLTLGEGVVVLSDGMAEAPRVHWFQDPGDTEQTAAIIRIHEVRGAFRIALKSDTSGLVQTSPGEVLGEGTADIHPLPGTERDEIRMRVDLEWFLPSYSGTGHDLLVTVWNGDQWNAVAADYDPVRRCVRMEQIESLTSWRISRITAPNFIIRRDSNGIIAAVTPEPGLAYHLQRSVDLVQWNTIGAAVASDTSPLEIRDNSASAEPGHAFYRLFVGLP